MARFVILLRAVNVGGTGMLRMAELRSLLSELGFTDVQSLLQSGNVVLTSSSDDPKEVERTVANGIEKQFAIQSHPIARTAKEIRGIIDSNPFPEEAKSEPGRLLVLFLDSDPAEEAEKSLLAACRDEEKVTILGRHVYMFYPNGAGASRLTTKAMERALGGRSTGRNWNTVLKLAEALEAQIP